MGDGIVFNLIVGLSIESLEGEFYLGYYVLLCEEGFILVYMYYWLNVGYKVLDFLFFGVYWEYFIFFGGFDVEELFDVYQWVGLYLQFFNFNGSMWVWFVFGSDVLEGNDFFYKFIVGMGF